MVILLETKNKSRSFTHLKRRLGMEHWFVVEPRGIGGGLCVFWRDATSVVLMKSEDFLVELKLWDEKMNCNWRLFAIYASTDDKTRREQWKEVSKQNEGGNYRPAASLRDFREFVARDELMDLGYEGYPFTWRNKREALPIQQRLDRGLATLGWYEMYPNTIIKHVILEGSDHALLVLSTDNGPKGKGRQFSYDGRWSKSEECCKLVGNDWRTQINGSHAYRFCEKLKYLRGSLIAWYKGSGRNSVKRIQQLKEEIRAAYKTNGFASKDVKQKEKELADAHRKEEAYWKVKSRNQWLREGDKNTKFFHAQTLKRHRFNSIRGIEDARGIWHETTEGIGNTAIDYFTELFQSCKPNLVEEVQSCMEGRLSLEDNQGLTAMVSDGEILEAAFQIPPTRSPGPDGFSGCFYQDHWDTVGSDVVKVVKAFWHSGSLLRKLNHTNVVLIPKVKCPKNMTQYRPIALCNVIYKIIAKVLTNRLKKVMPKVIGENQSAFVAGKHIQDNILVVHEVLHSLTHQNKGDQPGMAIKLDMAKAYDRVEWEFLLGMMASLGFPPLFCSWIKECISTVSFSVLINGSPTGFFRPNRGLRQGDPLSPFLFLLCTEGLSMLIRRSLERGSLHGFKISPTSVPLTHLFFADDSVVFGNASVEEAESIIEILQTYARGSGQVINRAKSSVFFGAKTPKCQKAKIVNSLGIQSKLGFGKYLGLQADFGHSKKAVFAEIRNKIEARMSGWAEQYLSQAGNEVLVKAVAMALPNYAMSCFRLPIGVCRDVERAIRNYWWRGTDQSKGIHWVSWDRLTKQKKAGGMGFKDLQCVNFALLAKIVWRITQKPLSLLASVLSEKYFPGKTFGEAPKGKNTSWGWKGLFEARKVLNLGLRWRVGNGKSINIRKEPWFPKPSTYRVIPKPNLEGTMVCDLIDPITKSWRTDLIESGFQREDVLPILSIPLSHAGIDDRLVPNKIKSFIWRCCNNALVVRRNLKRRHMRIDNVCGVCNAVNETENHLFFRCELSHVFWFCSPLHLNSYALEGRDFLESWCNFYGLVKERNNADDIRQDFAFGLWRLWKNRNEVIFKGIIRQPLDILEAWRKSTSAYKDCLEREDDDNRVRLPKITKASDTFCTKWQKPRFGTIKINSDAAWCKDTFRMGLGWLGRDFAGLLQAAGGTGSGFCHSAAAAEASAIRYALLACIDHGFNDIIIESDASLVIKMLKKEVLVDFSIECILGDIEMLVHKLRNVSFAFVPREGNRAAHSVAKYVFKEGRSFSWDCIGPDFLFNFLAKDVNLSIRL
ncbi:unnamed protein product [Malus baccata var. baccata]